MARIPESTKSDISILVTGSGIRQGKVMQAGSETLESGVKGKRR